MEPVHGGSSFGISKIIDVKIDEGGKQLYKVKWEPTWEPTENLATCRHLIDEFWSFVNKLKKNEVERSIQKRKMVDPVPNNSIKKLSVDNKTDVQKLITRTNATTVGTGLSIPNQSLFTPSNRLKSAGSTSCNISISSNNQRFDMIGIASPQNIQDQNSSMQKSLNFNGQQEVNSPDEKSVTMAFGSKTSTSRIKSEQRDIVKLATSSSPSKTSSSSINSSTLKYIENFSNPYVKIVVVCVICNKEQSLQVAAHWKRHYLTHVSDEEKPHRCHICQKAFIEASKLTKHLKTHEKKITTKKEEQFPIY